tara:strand:- start:9913 stop:10155 length:243 start_codon:yes stop_codon:yes gene_type:complete
MSLLIKNVKGEILEDLEVKVNILKKIESKFGYSDWFKIGTLEVFLQDYTKVLSVEEIGTTNNKGLSINKNKDFTEIEISY